MLGVRRAAGGAADADDKGFLVRHNMSFFTILTPIDLR